MKPIKILRVVYCILFITWMILIFAMSAQHADKSSQLSGGVVSKVVSILYPQFDALSETQQSELIHTITFIVRKLAHFSEYFILGVFGFLFANTYKKYKFTLRSLTATIFCVAYSVSDEIHQHFVPGRACRFTDVLIDSAGIVTATILLMIIFSKLNKRSGDQVA